MSQQLPWSTEPKESLEYVEIGHPNYGVLKIPRLGSLTPNEELAIAGYYVGLQQQSLSEAKVEIATILFRYRVDPKWTRQDTLDKIKYFPLIEDLYDFVNGERTRWAGDSYLVRLTGSDAYVAATNCAKSIGGVVAARPDIAGTYFVFADQSKAPLGFVIDTSFYTDESITEEPKK